MLFLGSENPSLELGNASRASPNIHPPNHHTSGREDKKQKKERKWEKTSPIYFIKFQAFVGFLKKKKVEAALLVLGIRTEIVIAITLSRLKNYKILESTQVSLFMFPVSYNIYGGDDACKLSLQEVSCNHHQSRTSQFCPHKLIDPTLA